MRVNVTATVDHDDHSSSDFLQQYVRRVIFYEADLFFKSIDKVSLKNFFLDDEFSHEDLTKPKFALYFMDLGQLGFRLMWFEDAALEALGMSRGSAAAKLSRSKWQLHGGVHSLMPFR